MKNVAITLATVLSVVVAASVGAIAYLMGSRNSDAPAPAAAITTAAAVTTTPTAASTSEAPMPRSSVTTVYVMAKTAAPARVTLSSLGSKPCAALFARGVGYSRMWEYYQQFGYPATMDIDHDGYPCETVCGDVN
ncbi:hypothetical protein [Actinoplanes rectilineatus]|uniref:hypothetical protein n=1 Tax=Actinoplanes rectilineatus TaxID=113571 RepID=UPI0005F2C268|nr:hypothetical protein [Actinoplanes rectilineatus]